MRFLSAGTTGTAALLLASLSYVACAPADSGSEGNPSTTTGGAPATGGAAATGGVTGTGGDVVATGGVSATGGAVATGGVAATGGATGTGGALATGGAGTGGGGSVDCSSLPICDGFESDTSGSAPAGWTVRSVNGTVVVDDTKAHSGTKSVRVKDGVSFLVNTDVLGASTTGKVYVRAFMWWNEAVPDGHTSYMSVAASATDEQQEMRFGGYEGVLNINASNGDGLAPDPYEYPTCTTCLTPAVGTWVCTEVMFDWTNEISTVWIDDGSGEKSWVVDEPSDFHNKSGPWPASVSALKIGYWGIGNAPQTIWYDDIAVRYDDRVGCQ